MAGRFSGPGQPYEGLAKRVGGEARWTGAVRLVEERLEDPRHWKRPRRIFVNSMSDLFHEQIPDTWIDRILSVIMGAPQHTYQILTKRPDRMREFLSNAGVERWRNLWWGVSVEDQATADARIPALLKTPASVRWVSYEPALGPVDFRRQFSHRSFLEDLDWIVVGGESGSGARPFDVGWARQTIAQCHAAGVPLFVKQLGRHPFVDLGDGHREEGRICPVSCGDRAGADPSAWSEDLRIRELPTIRK